MPVMSAQIPALLLFYYLSMNLYLRFSIMQHVIEKHGFTYCGIIHIASGDERLAYQRFV